MASSITTPLCAAGSLLLVLSCSRPPKEHVAQAPEPSPLARASAEVAAAIPVASSPATGSIPVDLNVVLISVDSMRADMPWAGYPRPIAPRLTALEGGSVSFTRAYALSSYTSMSLGGLLAGKLPSETKRDGYFFGSYAKDNVFFPEVLQSSRIRTVAAHAHGYFKDGGWMQGFDEWQIVPNLKWNNRTDENITSPQLEAIAERLLGAPEMERGRFFAWFHFLDPHDQYLPHPGIGPFGRGLRDRYDAEIAFTDHHVGKLIDFIEAQPWGARTAVIVTADHGEAFGEHSRYNHGFELWENLVRVPLFFAIPGMAARRIAEPRSHIDLAPTILALFGLAKPDGFRGQSLLDEIAGRPAEPRDIVIDLPATSDNDARRALVHDHYKLISFRSPAFVQVFDLDVDPGESKPLPRTDPAHVEMVSRFKALGATVDELPPTHCREACINGGYRKGDAGVK